MPKHVLITGSNGQLGQELNALVSKEKDRWREKKFFFTDRNSLDITNKDMLAKFIEINAIDTIVNCAAYTAVDKAEEDVNSAYNVNHVAVKNMAEIAKQKNIKLIHVSTDYVFDGTSNTPLVEENICNPQGVYAKSKHAGEEEVIRINPEGAIIIRTSWIYSTFGQNFVHTMLRLGKEREALSVVSDQVGTPTYARDLAAAILNILEHKAILSKQVEIFHYSNEGICSWYDFAKEIFDISNVNCIVSPISTEEYPTPAKRPLYSVLNKNKIINTYNLEIPYWKDSLKSCLKIID